MEKIIGVNTNGSYIYESEQNNSSMNSNQLAMEKVYEIEQCDNGWVLRDEDAVAYQVCQEKESDKQHHKFKNILGAWLYDDMKAFMDKELTSMVTIKITFEVTEE